jgi:osmotically-inducible protein OsmY
MTQFVDQIRTKLVADAVVKGGALVVPVTDGGVTLSGTNGDAPSEDQGPARLQRR